MSRALNSITAVLALTLALSSAANAQSVEVAAAAVSPVSVATGSAQVGAAIASPTTVISAIAAGGTAAAPAPVIQVAAADAAAMAPKAAYDGPTLVARIDLTSQRMTVTVGGSDVHSWKVSSGARGHHTPTGTFRPQYMARMHYSKTYYNAPMPYSVFFNGGIATHGTGATGWLGRPASHGCVRLQTANARKFFELVKAHGKANTRIIVTGSTPHSQPVASSSRRSSKPRYADNAPTSGRTGWQRQALGSDR